MTGQARVRQRYEVTGGGLWKPAAQTNAAGSVVAGGCHRTQHGSSIRTLQHHYNTTRGWWELRGVNWARCLVLMSVIHGLWKRINDPYVELDPTEPWMECGPTEAPDGVLIGALSCSYHG